MNHFLLKIKDGWHYFMSRGRNRYPCRFVKVINIGHSSKPLKITYSAISLQHIREITPKEIFSDPFLIEKFHPNDAAKIGFIAAAEVLLKNTASLQEGKERYQRMLETSFN